jgi:predicted SnoaL-like aldol condensation-catalyzing enzyme
MFLRGASIGLYPTNTEKMFRTKTVTMTLMIMSMVVFKSNSQNKNNPKMSNKEQAAAINKAVQNADYKGIEKLVLENYIQHTPAVADGRKGLLELLSAIGRKAIPAPQIKNVRAFEDGEYVVLHHDVNWPNRKVMFEIFRFDGALAAEHWSAIMDHPEKTANGHSMVDGETAITEKSKTEENKKLVRAFVETILIQGRVERILEFYHPDIIQHNPFIDNTVAGLVKGIEELQKKGLTLQIEKIHRVLGEGNFVLVVSEGKFAGKPTAFYDLFRAENGKIVEHWDVLQEIPEKMAHVNGMF